MVSRGTAEKIVRWHTEFGCRCRDSKRLDRVLGILGGGVDTASMRSRPFLETRENDEKVPAKISDIIHLVLKERSLTNPQVATAVFKRNRKRYSFCECSDQRGNCSVSVMTAWFNDINDKDIEVTCPSCADDYSRRRGSVMKKSMSLTRILTAAVSGGGPSAGDITEQLLSMTLSTTGGCGRNSEARLSSFNGSWTGLTYNIAKKTIDGEILMSNAVFSSCRLQPSCSCSEILYIVSSMIGKLEEEDVKFAFKASEVKILGGGEFLYIKYPIYRQGSVFDRVSSKTLKRVLTSEPNGLAVCETMKEEDDDSGGSSIKKPMTDKVPPQPPPPVKASKNRRDAENATTEHGNVVDMHQLMAMMLSKGKSSSIARQKGGNKRKRDESLTGGMGQASSIFLLSPPHINEKCITLYQQTLLTIPTKAVRISWSSGDSHLLNVKILPETGKKILYPSNNTILSPPLIIRTEYNVYRVLSGLLMFFDHIEKETSCASISLNDNAAHQATFKLLSRIRESSLRKSVAAINEEGDVHVSVKSVPPKLINNSNGSGGGGVSLSQLEVNKREICSATTLNILASLVK
uniref:Wsv440-like protein n=1 Tax=Hemigrapsus takanoi nimavirus TaxID=2133792 RepID=A0A401IP01_9VIRU|nr:MAG: wsv440-like protein [Hemigrapsus takanoi nimavirus]GBG35335.1 wsv440-like protein [Hemigrapsus takanoi nimavirus]